MQIINSAEAQFTSDVYPIEVIVEGKTYSANYILDEGNIRLTTSTLPDGEKHSTYAALSEVAHPEFASHHSNIAEHMLLGLIGAAIQKAAKKPLAISDDEIDPPLASLPLR